MVPEMNLGQLSLHRCAAATWSTSQQRTPTSPAWPFKAEELQDVFLAAAGGTLADAEAAKMTNARDRAATTQLQEVSA